MSIHISKNWQKNHVVALSGKIASGKSFVLKCFNALGFHILSADNIVCGIYEDLDVMKEVFCRLQLLFPSVPSKDKLVNAVRNWALLVDSAQTKSEKLLYLSNEFAPFIKKKRQILLEAIRKRSSRAIVYEIPLLHETSQEASFDYVINILCPYHIRLTRALKRYKMSREYFDSINAVQSANELRIAKSDVVLFSAYSKRAVLEQVKRIIKYGRNNIRH